MASQALPPFKIVVLDDDPTGIQTIHGCTLLTRWDPELIEEGGRRIPTSDTEFARDSVFGYSSSHLPAYVEEKSGGRIPADQVRSLSVQLLRDPDATALTNFLRGFADQEYVVVNAERYEDLDRLAAVLLAVVAEGKHFCFQSAASLVKALSGVSDRPLLGSEIRRFPGPGIVVIGSYVGKTTRQLQALLDHPSVSPLEIDLPEVLASADREALRILAFFRECQGKAKTPIVYTPRVQLTFPSTAERLEAGRHISSFLARLVRELPFEPSFVVAKGGITAHTVMVEGLGITKARVLGQILPGIPVISAAAPTARNDSPQIPFVIFPGNVGEEKALLHVFTVLDFPVPGPR